MKNMRKLASVLLVLVMLFALAMPVAAASITIEGGASSSEYSAYRLLDAGVAVEGAGYVFTMNDKYETALVKVYKAAKGVADEAEVTDAQVVDYISKLTPDETRTFADAVYAEIKTLEAEYTTKNDVFADVDKGYYLIAETTIGADVEGATDTKSLVMLDTAAEGSDENITITTKEDVPTLDKSVEEKNDSTGVSSWDDEADYDSNDKINYKLVGTVSSKYADYESYYYSFSDNMSEGLTLDESSIQVFVGDVEVTSQFNIDSTAHSFTATANLKELTDVTITGDTEIVVTYTAILNENAVVGQEGNKNTAGLEYENDPYHKGDGDPGTPDKPDEPGKTPEDTTIVFTYDVIVNKTDDLGEALEGAGFTLYKWDVNVAGEDKWAAVGDEITGVTTFEFEKLDEGKYKLVETKVPAGYNKAADIEFEIVSTLDGEKLTALKVIDKDGKEMTNFTITVSSGEIVTTVVNETGVTLPETGGMGTTLFYVVGGLMIAAAVVLLITKRRMNAE